MAFDTNHGAVFGIIQMHTREPASASAFYAQVLGWQEIPVTPGKDVGSFMTRPGGSNPEAILLRTGDNTNAPASQWIPQIAVDNIHDVVARCEAAGGEVIAGISQVSNQDPAQMCTIRDPEGAVLGLIQVVKE